MSDNNDEWMGGTSKIYDNIFLRFNRIQVRELKKKASVKQNTNLQFSVYSISLIVISIQYTQMKYYNLKYCTGTVVIILKQVIWMYF